MPGADDAARPKKDRLIQTRVPRDLEVTLKEEARRRQLSVSHLIRSVLEDAFHLVDGVVADVDEIVGDSARLARNVRRNARRLVAPRSAPVPAGGRASQELSHVVAWNEVVVHRRVACSRCDIPLARGERAFVGISEDPGADRAWLCPRCIDTL